MRSLLLGLVFLVWLFLGYLFHQEQQKCCSTGADGAIGQVDDTTTDNTAAISTGEATTPEKDNLTSKASGPILFNYSDQSAILGDGWKTFKSKLLAGFKSDEIMEITGQYTRAEKAPAGFANMGEARADAAREALGLGKDRVLLKGVLSDKGVDKKNPYEAVNFANIGAPKMVDESIPNKTIIRFPYDSNNKLNNKSVEDYLNKVAKRVKGSGEKIKLTGYTDSDGAADYNKNLGQRRANIIRDYLRSKGVNRNQIISSSKGEESPIASNSTAAGKAENRRTEVEIIK